MARLKIRLLLSATLALSTGGLFLAAAAPAAGAAAAPAAVGGSPLHRPCCELRQGHRGRRPHLWRGLPGHQVRLRAGDGGGVRAD